MKPGQTLARSVLAVAVAAVLGGAAVGPSAAPLAARADLAAPQVPPTDNPGLRIASVSPWVDSEGTFDVRFEPSPAIAPDSRLSVTVHQALAAEGEQTLRDRVEDIIDGGSPGRVLQRPEAVQVTELGDLSAGLFLSLPIRSRSGTSDRIFLPNAGIHPVELLLTAPDGPELWREVVFLNRLPRSDRPQPKPVQVTLVLPVESGPSVGVGGTSDFSLEEESSLRSVDSLLETVPGAPLTLAVRPNTLDGLDRTAEPWAASLLSALGSQQGTDVISQMPYTDVDSGGLVESGATDELLAQVLVGAATVADRTDRTPDPGTWLLDETTTTPTLGVLAQIGVRSVLLPVRNLDLGPGVDDETAMTRPLRLEGGAGVRALAYDSSISRRLADTGVEPAARAHQAVALMMTSWFGSSRSETSRRSTAILLSPATDPAVVESLRATLAGGGPLSAQPEQDPLPPPVEGEPEPSAVLAPRTPPDLRPAVDAVNESRRSIGAYRSMTDDADTDLALWDQLNNESPSRALDAARRGELQAAVRNGIATKIAQIEVPPSRRVVVTSDDTTIPLRFRNDLPFSVQLLMRVRSARLDFPDPVSEITLQPGENRVDLSVSVQAPGESLLRVELSSPVEGIEIAVPDIPVRSTAISGVGAALSAVSLLFLIGWWVHTWRRSRRTEERNGGTHPVTELADR